MAESADALDSGSSGSNTVCVQVTLSAPSSQMAIICHLRAFFIIVEYVNMIYIYGATTTLLRQNAKINLHNHQSNFRSFAALALSQSRRHLNHFQLSEQ